MDAIFRAQGKQVRAVQDGLIRIPTLEAEPGDRVEFDEVLLAERDGDVHVGAPSLKGASVAAEVVAVDETYMHSAYNNSDTVRLILMTDVARPLRSKIVQKAYYYFGRYFNRMFAIDNVDSKYSGFGNKLGKGINAYRALLRKFKTKNKPLYVLTKVTVTFSILGFIAYKLI